MPWQVGSVSPMERLWSGTRGAAGEAETTPSQRCGFLSGSCRRKGSLGPSKLRMRLEKPPHGGREVCPRARRSRLLAEGK